MSKRFLVAVLAFLLVALASIHADERASSAAAKPSEALWSFNTHG
jgi:hypothetical protein